MAYSNRVNLSCPSSGEMNCFKSPPKSRKHWCQNESVMIPIPCDLWRWETRTKSFSSASNNNTSHGRIMFPLSKIVSNFFKHFCRTKFAKDYFRTNNLLRNDVLYLDWEHYMLSFDLKQFVDTHFYIQMLKLFPKLWPEDQNKTGKKIRNEMRYFFERSSCFCVLKHRSK